MFWSSVGFPVLLVVFCQLAVLFSLLVPTAFHNRAFAVVHRRQNERNTVCDGGATRFSYFVFQFQFQFQFDRTKYENRLLISFADFRIPTGDTKNGLIYRYFVFLYDVRNRTKYEIRFIIPFFVFRTSYEKQNNGIYTDLCRCPIAIDTNTEK